MKAMCKIITPTFEIIFLFLFLASLTFGQSQDSALKIKNWKSVYSKSEKVSFFIENISPDTIYVEIGAEQYQGNKWIVLTEDIFRTEISKTSFVTILKPNTSEKIVWTPYVEIIENNEVKVQKQKAKGKYRFFVLWGNDIKHMENKFIASPFIKN